MNRRDRSIRPGLWCVVPLLTPFALQAQPTEFNPADYAAPTVCGDGLVFDTAGKCKVDPAIAKDQAKCQAASLDFKNDQCTATAEQLAARCKPFYGYKATLKAQVCTYEKSMPVSASADYLGDCFAINAVQPHPKLVSGQTYLVTAQTKVDDTSNDKRLTLVPGDFRWLPPSICGAKKIASNGAASAVQINASELLTAGASRRGWAYGLLTMPYKYFPDDKAFVSGAPIGPYLGFRFGQAGSGLTAAAAVTLGQVTGQTVDPTKLDSNNKPTVTGTTQLPAIAASLGLIFDIAKSQGAKPFKAGVFVGQDWINSDPTIFYKYNRKKWIALQLGYDFTDN